MVTIEEELTKTELFCDMYPLNRPPKRFLLGFEVIDLGGRFHGDFQSKKFHIPHFEKPEALLFPMIPDVCVCNDVHTISKTKPLLGFGVLTIGVGFVWPVAKRSTKWTDTDEDIRQDLRQSTMTVNQPFKS